MERDQKNLIGIAGGHREQVVPSNSMFTNFFDLLRAQGCRSELIDEKFKWDNIDQYSAVLIGVPEQSLTKDEAAVVRDWVNNGGHLLLLGTMGGDKIPYGYHNHNETNLDELTWGIQFDSTCLGIIELDPTYRSKTDTFYIDEMPRGTRFIPQVDIDVSALLNHKIDISYELGCTLWLQKSQVNILGQLVTVDNDAIKITHSLLVPDFAAVVVGTARLLDYNFEEIFGHEYRPSLADRYVFLRAERGQGTITAIGSARMFCDLSLNNKGNLEFLNWLFSLWLPNQISREMQRRMRRPQRHRLLHGYPMSPLINSIELEHRADVEHRQVKLLSDLNRKFIVGVLPHPFCNPSVKGCGFCTFPHEVYTNTKVDHIVKDVIKEIESFFYQHSFLNSIDVPALYFGGGTANLTPPNLFQELCRALNKQIDLSQAEVTLEGVPIYFTTHQPTILEILKNEMPVRQLRISMGVQTFNPAQIKRMGRGAFGDREKIEAVVKFAHELDYIVSGDLLFNLPGQSLAEMKNDIDIAIDLGFDQICLYHLVMFEGLGTEWSMDDQLLAQLPDNNRAAAHWLELREYLIAKGYRQNSLTNFEKAEISAGSCRFIYEDYGYRPEHYDLLGFGPSAISLISDKNFQSAIKLLNPEGSAEYSQLINNDQACNRAFFYGARDMKILYLTRKVVLLGLKRADYRAMFDQDPLSDFPVEFNRLQQAGLLEIRDDEIKLTPKGMFYADTIAGIFAWQQTHILRFRDVVKGKKVMPYRPVSLRPAYDDSAYSFM